MNVADYKQAGYNMSQHIEQTTIDLAEQDVMQAYIAPMSPQLTINSYGVKDAVMCLVNLLVLQRSAFATRAGAKDKTSMQSVSSEKWSLLEQWAEPCKMKLAVVANSVGAKPWRVSNDLCGIYYSKHFIGY